MIPSSSTDLILQEEQIINRKFKEFIHSKDKHLQASVNQFTNEQTEVIAKRFEQLCNKQAQMTYEQFRRGLGLLGREESFICRIFNLIDEDGDGLVSQQNYLNYLRIILKGNQLEKARLGWLILTENKGDMDLKDFMQFFQEISVVWNALTGQIVMPKKKYVEELFNTFDVDQDQFITFSDYRLFFNQHLQLAGWFEYFNDLDYDQDLSKAELEKIRLKLRNKLKIGQNQSVKDSPEELRILAHDCEFNIQKKLIQMTKDMRETAQQIRKQKESLVRLQKMQKDESDPSFYLSHPSTTQKSIKTNSEQSSNLSIKRFYRYHHDESHRSSSINKIHLRKQQLQRQTKNALNSQVGQELKNYLQNTYRLMDLCHSYRTLKDKQRQYSPTKLKRMQAQLSMVSLEEAEQQNTKATKQKMTVYFGHENWNLVLNIMVGLRKSLITLGQISQIKESHFTEQHEFYLGNKAFLSGRGPEAFKNMQSFLFIEIAPAVFSQLRTQYGVSNHEYQKSVGPEGLLNQLLTGDLTALNQKCSTGKSGAFFYLTSDNRIFLKTLPKHEFIFFTNIIQNYYRHMTDHQNTLIVRIYGLYKLKIYQNKQKINTIYFISMENIFYNVKAHPRCRIRETYDLKGSLYGRTGSEKGQLKDQDWIQRKRKIVLPESLADIFRQQITVDSRFFKKNNINDYSLMVALVDIEGDFKPSGEKNFFKRIEGGAYSKERGLLYVLSIIDILTVFETKKNLEYIFKSTFLSKDVSCIPPSDYCARFRNFILGSVQ